MAAAAFAAACGSGGNAPRTGDKLAHVFAKNDVTIAVTDSGLGGLSIMADLGAKLKEAGIFGNVRLVFFNALFSNDSGYNSLRTREEKIAVFNSALESLDRNIRPDVILVGCNTLSVFIPDTPYSWAAKIPVLGIVEPGVDLIARALNAAPTVPVLLFGTETTIGEDEHRRRLLGLGIAADRIVTQACPELASFIEKAPGSEDTGLLIESYVDEAAAKIRGPKSKAVVGLACTHYGYSLDLWRKAFSERGIEAVTSKSQLRDGGHPGPGPASKPLPGHGGPGRGVVHGRNRPGENRGARRMAARISPETADALAGYKLMPDLFEWRALVQK